MLQLLLYPIVLMILLWIVARDNAELELTPLFFVAFGIALGSAVIINYLSPFLGIFSVIPAMVVAVFILMRFCGTTLQQSIIVVVLLSVWHVAYSLVFSTIITV